MNSSVIRNKFLDFFAKRGHLIVPSAPLVLKNDPSLLFTNSGMVQFKDYFMGHAVPESKRIADTQKCIRVSGKHNDLEDVGFDTYHHTLFEMLGNWSFGDYFKKEAIAWAWELLTKEYHLPVDRLYVTVFGGYDEDNLPIDDESVQYWKPIVGADKIIYGMKEDNFWEMGDTGPCGPCSEIHIDLRPDADRNHIPGKDLINQNHPLVIEIWNLVFIQFNRLVSGKLENLPHQHVDTGMGFERLCMAIQGKISNYDTDVFKPLVDFVSTEANTVYGEDEKKDVAIRVVVDHARAVALSVADGQLPSNTGAGYVIRRILRRAVRYGFSYLGFDAPCIYKLIPLLADQFKDVFPELYNQQDYVQHVMSEEEQSFLKTLDKGLKRFDTIRIDLSEKCVPGTLAFELYDTYGFPLDLTSLIAKEWGLSVDEKSFKLEMEKQQSRSRAVFVEKAGDWVVVNEDEVEGFVGYDAMQAKALLLRYRKVQKKDKELYQLVFNRTPFYAESGGQVGDVGMLKTETDTVKIVDTKKEHELMVHLTEQLPSDTEACFDLKVDSARRALISINHSATHLLHAALRQVLGKYVEQRGSWVGEKGLRFDFSHFTAVTKEEMTRIERLVNEKIRMNILLDERRNMPIEQAKGLGAMALFGEKYGAFVRVIIFDSAYSVELCGGTHVSATGHIGMFKITSESAIAAGVRRIEALTAGAAEQYVYNEIDTLQTIRSLFKHPRDVVVAAESLLSEKHALERTLHSFDQKRVDELKKNLLDKGADMHGVYFIAEKIEVRTVESLKEVAYALRNQFEELFLVLAADVVGKPHVVVMLGKKTEKSNVFHAGTIVKELAVEIDGRGGGQSFFAIAGGKNLEGLHAVLKKARNIIRTT